MSTREFETTISVNGSRVFIQIPFDPNAVWGARERHHIRGTVNGQPIRGALGSDEEGYFLLLGAAWRRAAHLELEAPVRVVLFPEGPQQESLTQDIGAALAAEPEALAFFEALATFYRKNYVRWIESAKRPETRAARIAEMLALLKARKKQK
jgi:hypothetical protein